VCVETERERETQKLAAHVNLNLPPGLFGAAAPPPAPAPAPFNFGGQPASGGLFGGPPPAPAAGGLFGAPPAGGFGGFSGFGAAAPSAPPPAEEEDEEEEEEATPAALDVGAAMAFKASNARVHAMTPGTKAWVDRGRGVLTVRSPASGEAGAAAASSARPHVVFTTDTGRVLLNAVLYKGLVVGKARKPHMVTATLANAAALAAGSEDGEGGGGGSGGGGATTLAPHLFTLASEEEADAFMAALKEAVAKHCA